MEKDKNTSVQNNRIFTIADVGLASCLFGSNVQAAKDRNYVESLIKQYKQTVISKMRDSCKDSDAYLTFVHDMFEPRFYVIFGHFSYLSLFLCDDFTFTSRIFQPFSHYLGKTPVDNVSFQSFISQGSTQILPEINLEVSVQSENTYTSNIIERWKKTADYHFIGISNIKLQNDLIDKIGTKWIGIYLKQVLSSVADNQNVHVFPSLSFAWNEITLYFFGNNLNEINNCVIEAVNLKNDSGVKYVAFSQTAFGYSFLHRESLECKDTTFITRLFIKNDNIKSVAQKLKNYDPSLAAGKGDLSTRRMSLSDYLQLESDIYELKNVPPYITKTYTTLLFKNEDNNEIEDTRQRNEDTSQSFDDMVYPFKYEDLHSLYIVLRKQRISNPVRDRLYNLFIKFNHAYTDNIMGAYFINMWPIMKRMYRSITHEDTEKRLFTKFNGSIYEYSNHLLEWSEHVEKAITNRYGSSYDMDEVPDWNIDFSGGYQQLILTYNYVYLGLARSFGEFSDFDPYKSKLFELANLYIEDKLKEIPYSFLYISSHPGQKSNGYSVRLNSYHIYHPEIFANIVAHEVLNHRWLKFGDYKNLDENVKHLTISGPETYSNTTWTRKMIRYGLCDYLTYHTTFGGNSDPFYYWLIGTMLGDASAYFSDGILNKDTGFEFLVRCTLIARILGHFNNEIYDSESFYKLVPQLYTIWIENKKIIHESIKKLSTDEHLIESIHEINRIIIGDISKNLNFSTVNQKISEINKEYKEKIEIFTSALTNGEVISKKDEIRSDESFSDLMILSSLNGALLNLIYTMSQMDQNLTRIMAYRDMDDVDKPGRIDVKTASNDVLLDELTGVSVYEPNARRKIFRARCTWIVSVWKLAKRYGYHQIKNNGHA